MSVLEQVFTNAIKANEIEGVIMQGRDLNGNSYSKAIGSRTLLDGSSKPLSTSDITFLASSTKLLTTIAALQCCEKGLLSLDADLAPLLPEAKRTVLVPSDNADEEPKLERLQKPLTLRHLLTHSSGMVYDLFNPMIEKWRTTRPVPENPPDVTTRYSSPLAFQPGERFEYGIGLDWAGWIVEQVTGLKLDQYIRANMLKPVGVAASEVSFFPVQEGLGDRMLDLNPKDVKGAGLSVAMGHDVHGDAQTGCFGGQGGYASPEAYIEVLYSLTANDEKLLRKETVAEMLKPQLEPRAKEVLTYMLATPSALWFGNNTEGSDRDFGLGGLHVGEGDTGGLGANSITWGGGVNSAWFIDPTNGVCGFASLQLGLPANTDKSLELKGIFRKQLKDQLREGFLPF